MISNKYISVPYVDGGRDMSGLDCWGLALSVRRDMGLPELPSDPMAVRGNGYEIASQFKSISSSMAITEPKQGSLAAVFKGPLFVHVGVVIEADGRLFVLETNPCAGVYMRKISDFNSSYYKVVYYSDKNFPEPA